MSLWQFYPDELVNQQQGVTSLCVPVGGAPAPSATSPVSCAPPLGPRTSGWKSNQLKAQESADGDDNQASSPKTANLEKRVYLDVNVCQ